MRNKNLAVLWLVLGVGSLIFALVGSSAQGIAFALAILFFILAYAANRRPLPVEPFTGKPRPETVVEHERAEEAERKEAELLESPK